MISLNFDVVFGICNSFKERQHFPNVNKLSNSKHTSIKSTPMSIHLV